ncbi:holin [Propionibacterium phage PFR2]|uniref:Holin n=2 Tax=Pulverervirus PFR1 TaxID=2170091 RepID=A0A173G9G7_9CAUD|nr:holin [Propionibacterium freudenreichii]YP_009287698.1 holin [Propionibacterium phage PFR1]YP_009290931.1 holin [Propionibacterium phage PFR2]ANH49887.1 hypothetical protein PFR1_22 [Propionibacterium phage PFR1]ANH49947.1 hypothetical protein PFR2_22 [Propionibacterium phage PFR2]MDK9674453.1 hypothetical protein [Propionibacterium freudenreichii]CEI46761.1 Putative uncharacterized protein [Propionibacterium freudenreichii]SCQ46765.1 Hypothetical protein PFR_JS7-1_1815 [Propionibacterium
MIWTLAFWKGAGERALKTAAQTAVGLMGTSALIQQVPWAVVASGTAMAVVLSLITSIGNADFTAGVPTTAKGLEATTVGKTDTTPVTPPARVAGEVPAGFVPATAPDPVPTV